MQKLTKPITTYTSTTVDNNPNYTGTLQKTSNYGYPISVPAFSNPNLKVNMLPVNSLIRQWGAITFTPEISYIVNTKHNHLPSIIGTTTFRKGLYEFKPAQTVSHSSRVLSINAFSPSHPKSTTITTTPSKPSVPSPLVVTSRKELPIRIGDIPPYLRNPKLSMSDLSFHAWHLIFNHIQLKTL